jgi:hypothetical protein
MLQALDPEKSPPQEILKLTRPVCPFDLGVLRGPPSQHARASFEQAYQMAARSTPSARWKAAPFCLNVSGAASLEIGFTRQMPAPIE